MNLMYLLLSYRYPQVLLSQLPYAWTLAGDSKCIKVKESISLHPHLQPIPQACEGLGSGCSNVKERTFTTCHRFFFTGQAIYQWSQVFTPNFGPNTKKLPKKYEQVTVKRMKTCQHCTWSISTSGSAAAPPLATDS